MKIEIVKIDDDYSYFKIVYQNTDVLKRGDFVDTDLRVESYACPHFPGSRNVFFLRGTKEQLDNKTTIIKTEHIEELMRRVNSINEKYGIRKRWRAEEYSKYFVVDAVGEISRLTENKTYTDGRYHNSGNYFKTKEDAENYELYKAFQKLKESN